MKKALLLITLALPGVGMAELDPGTNGKYAEWKVTTATGTQIGKIYVPGPNLTGYGNDYWYWNGTPWSQTFKIEYVGEVSSKNVPSGWTEEAFEGGAFAAGAVPGSGTLPYNCRITYSGTSIAGYVDRGTDYMDWWTPLTISYLSETTVYTFTALSGSVSVNDIEGGIETDEL